MIERQAYRRAGQLKTLTQASLRHDYGAMVTVRVVPPATKESMSRPGAASAAQGGVLALSAKAPQMVDRGVKVEVQLGRELDDLG
jgi:hypothetical protein